jgi:hypothetical protein
VVRGETGLGDAERLLDDLQELVARHGAADGKAQVDAAPDAPEAAAAMAILVVPDDDDAEPKLVERCAVDL